MGSLATSYSCSAVLTGISRIKTTYRANGEAYFFGGVIGGRCIRGGPLAILRSICTIVISHVGGPGRSSCAGTIVRGNVSRVLGGLKRRYARVVLTTGGPSDSSLGFRVSSFVCRYVVLVTRGGVA